MTTPAKVVVVGLGNIGSHVVGLLARLRNVVSVVLVDHDRYEASNVAGQDISPSDLGRPKAYAQARRLHRLAPSLTVVALVARIESVPLGRLRADVILACLDSRRARQTVNEIAGRLGIPWIDAGVDGDSLRARVNVFLPGAEHACGVCSWADVPDELVEQTYPCQPSAGTIPPTNAPAELGAFAAALQVTECRKLLEGRTEEVLSGRQALHDLRAHRQVLSSFTRNPDCRRAADHEPWLIVPGPAATGSAPRSLADLVTHARANGAGAPPHTLQVAGQRFIAALRCAECGIVRNRCRLERVAMRDPRCRSCGGRLVAGAFDIHERLSLEPGGPAQSHRLDRLGLEKGDVVSLTGDEATVHMELLDA